METNLKGIRRVPYIVCGPPTGKWVNKPSVEYSGYGDLLCLECWGVRYFRSDYNAVKEQIERFIEWYTCENQYLSYNDLYNLFGISESTMGGNYGYAPSVDYRIEMSFELTLCGRGTKLYEEMGEKVLLIEPSHGSEPFEGFMEV